MLHRVRNLKDDTILIYIGDLYYSENTILYYPECLEIIYQKVMILSQDK